MRVYYGRPAIFAYFCCFDLRSCDIQVIEKYDFGHLYNVPGTLYARTCFRFLCLLASLFGVCDSSRINLPLLELTC